MSLLRLIIIHLLRPKYVMKWSLLNDILLKSWTLVFVILRVAVGIATLIIKLKVDECILHGVQKHSGSRGSILNPFWAPEPVSKVLFLPLKPHLMPTKSLVFTRDDLKGELKNPHAALLYLSWAVIKVVTYPHINCFCVSKCQIERNPSPFSNMLLKISFVLFPENRHLCIVVSYFVWRLWKHFSQKWRRHSCHFLYGRNLASEHILNSFF